MNQIDRVSPRFLSTLPLSLLLSIVALTAFAGSASAFFYGTCGNGVVERDPKHFGTTTVRAEQCDLGTAENNRSDSGCRWDCWINQNSYENGIIESFHGGEECDDGNRVAGDGCSPAGKFEATAAFFSNVCGNGVKELGEACDDGNIINGDGCSASCRAESGVVCADVPVCGNGKVEQGLGEECDDGSANGTVASQCTSHCVLKGTPYFSKDPNRVAYWSFSSGSMDGEVLGASDVGRGSIPINPLGSAVVMARAAGIEITNHGRILTFPDTPGKQFAGVFLSGQKVDELSRYLEEKIRLHLVMKRSEANSNQTWGDDAIGFVFGMKPGEQTSANSSDYLMLSWRSRVKEGGFTKIEPTNCGSNYRAAPVSQGLRLYAIHGAPSYDELWQMADCNGSGHITPIDTSADPATATWNRIVNPFYSESTFYASEAHIYASWTKKHEQLQLVADLYADKLIVYVNNNKAIEVHKADLPATIHWPTTGEAGFYFLGMDGFTADLGGYAVRATRADSGQYVGVEEEGYMSSSCHGYCGNGRVETYSGVTEECDDGNTIEGDGCENDCTRTPVVVPTPPPVDVVTKKIHVCKDITIDDGSGGTTTKPVCYGGSLELPLNNAEVPMSKPPIVGTYIPGTKVTVSILEADDSLRCRYVAKTNSGDVAQTVDSNHLLEGIANYNIWTDEEYKRCALDIQRDGFAEGTYKVKVNFAPSQGDAPAESSDNTVTHTVTIKNDAPYLRITSPPGYPGVLRSDSGTIAVGGDYENIATSDAPKIVLCRANTMPPACTETNAQLTESTKKWTSSVPLPPGKPEGDYTLKVTTSDGSKILAYKEIVVDNTPPGQATVTNLAPHRPVIESGGRHVMVQGEITPPSAQQTDFVEVVITCAQPGPACQGAHAILKADKAGKFQGNVPFPTGEGPYTVTTTAVDQAGNKGAPQTVSDVIILSEAPNVEILSPPPSSYVGPTTLSPDNQPIVSTSSSGETTFEVKGLLEPGIAAKVSVEVRPYYPDPNGGGQAGREKAELIPAQTGETFVRADENGRWTARFKCIPLQGVVPGECFLTQQEYVVTANVTLEFGLGQKKKSTKETTSYFTYVNRTPIPFNPKIEPKNDRREVVVTFNAKPNSRVSVGDEMKVTILPPLTGTSASPNASEILAEGRCIYEKVGIQTSCRVVLKRTNGEGFPESFDVESKIITPADRLGMSFGRVPYRYTPGAIVAGGCGCNHSESGNQDVNGALMLLMSALFGWFVVRGVGKRRVAC